MKRIVSHWLFSGTAVALDDTGRHIRIIEKKISPTEMQLFLIQTPEIDMSQVAWQLDNEDGVMTRVGLTAPKRPQDAWYLSCRNYPVLLWTGKYKE